MYLNILRKIYLLYNVTKLPVFFGKEDATQVIQAVLFDSLFVWEVFWTFLLVYHVYAILFS